MKLGKKVVQKETNPFKSQGPVTRRFTLCKISLAEKGLTLFTHYGVTIDLDDEPLFTRELEAVIPQNARYYDRDHEIYHITENYLELVKSLACTYYERVIFQPATGEQQILKTGSTDLTVPQAPEKTNDTDIRTA